MTMTIRSLAFAVVACLSMAQAHAQSTPPERVTFPSQDGKTTLTGYLYLPHAPRGRVPAVVMMHGRAGAYSSLANGVYDASTLSKRHQAWGELWASQGYVALMVDGFGPRGYPAGFPRHSYDSRPDGAERGHDPPARRLRRAGVAAHAQRRGRRAHRPAGLVERRQRDARRDGGRQRLHADSQKGFAAALAFYPACGLKGAFESGLHALRAGARVHGRRPTRRSRRSAARRWSRQAARNGGDIEIKLYPGATHGFDDPGAKRQKVEANADATEDAVAAR